METGDVFLATAISRLTEYKGLAEKAMAQLTTGEMHRSPNATSNSIAVMIAHLHGNMLSRWTDFLTTDGEKPWRQRDAEFIAAATTREELLTRWNEGWATLFATLQNLTAPDLLKTITIRSQPLIVIDAINRQVAHYSSHVGQIIYLAKWMKADAWQSLSIPRGGSDAYTQSLNSPQEKQ